MAAAKSMEERAEAALRSASVISPFTYTKPFETHLALKPSYLTFPELYFSPLALIFSPHSLILLHRAASCYPFLQPSAG